MRARVADAWLREIQPTSELCRLFHGVACRLCTKPVTKITDDEFERWLAMHRREAHAILARLEALFPEGRRMKISLQRQCDGFHPQISELAQTCDARVELTLELPDRMPMPEWKAAWDAALALLGWRCIGGRGEPITIGIDGSDRAGTYVIPDAKTWIVCPEHAKGTVCARCGHRECSCMCGPRFVVRIATGEET